MASYATPGVGLEDAEKAVRLGPECALAHFTHGMALLRSPQGGQLASRAFAEALKYPLYPKGLQQKIVHGITRASETRPRVTQHAEAAAYEDYEEDYE